MSISAQNPDISGERQSGQDVRTQNVMSCQAISNIVKSSLGPVGLDKMLVDDIGDVTITNDGATILRMLEVEHPAAKKLMEMKKSNSKSKRAELVIPEELKKIDTVRGVGGKSTLGTLQRKLFGKEKVKALTEVKVNTRTLSMVLRSERELLTMNKDQEVEIAELKFQLEEKNREVEKLKDLCLKQREEIKSLKSAVLFPDAMNSQISQMQELNQARQIIPNLQKQVISLNGQLQCIAQDLAEVKANKYLSESCYWQAQTSSYDSLEFSSGSLDGLALEDLNPCLTPYTKKKPKEYERVDSAEESLSGRSTITTTGGKFKSSPKSVKLSKSSEVKAGRKSEESKGWYRGGRMY